jgi:hypothetical protein
MKKSKATEALRVASEIAVIRAALKKRGYHLHKQPRQAAWKVFNSNHCYLLTYQPAPISAWVLHPQNDDSDSQYDSSASRQTIETIIQSALKKQPATITKRAS